jgi:hypothetical protein
MSAAWRRAIVLAESAPARPRANLAVAVKGD